MFSASAPAESTAVQYVCAYASMVEYGVSLEAWRPTSGLAFPREHLYQFMSPQTLEQMESIYPNTIEVSYANSIAYVTSYIGNMFDIQAMLDSGDTSTTAMTLRLILCLSTARFILASVPQYADVTREWGEQLSFLLKGLKQGSRNFGKQAIVSSPDVRVESVTLGRNGRK